METAGTSSSSEKERMAAAEEAITMIAQGKRNLVCGEIPNAVTQFQEACKVLAKAYGETAKECAEAYFYYGQALLDLARMENGVLGNALKGADAALDEDDDANKSADEQFEKAEDLDGEEREKLRQEVYDAMAEDGKVADSKPDGKGDEKKEDGKKEETKEEKKEEKTEAMETDKKEEKTTEKTESEDKTKEEKKNGVEEEGDTAEEEGEEEGEEEEGEDTAEEDTAEETSQDEAESGEKKENPDDISNLQLAWEMLELAKVIYLKDEAKEAKLKAAESFLKLGEVSLETEQYEQAVSDFKECLKIQESVLEAEDRLLAETHYQLGLAYGFDKKYDESITHYKKAIQGIEDKVAKLSKVVEANAESKDKGKEPAAKDDPVKTAQQEIKELQEILPDIKSKVEDMEEEKKNIDELKNIAKEAMGGLVGATVEVSKSEQSTEAQKKASDISHLVRRKRKPDEEEEDKSDSKKTKQEDGSGDAPTKQNGIAKSPSKSMDVEEQKKIEAAANQPKEAVAS